MRFSLGANLASWRNSVSEAAIADWKLCDGVCDRAFEQKTETMIDHLGLIGRIRERLGIGRCETQGFSGFLKMTQYSCWMGTSSIAAY